MDPQKDGQPEEQKPDTRTPEVKLAEILRLVYIGFSEAELYISGGITRDRFHAWADSFYERVVKDFPL